MTSPVLLRISSGNENNHNQDQRIGLGTMFKLRNPSKLDAVITLKAERLFSSRAHFFKVRNGAEKFGGAGREEAKTRPRGNATRC